MDLTADIAAFRSFVDRHAATLPRQMLRYAIEKLPADERKCILEMGK